MRWNEFVIEANASAINESARLERMLSSLRRVAASVFWKFFVLHPVVKHLAVRLVWGVYADDKHSTIPSTVFRITPEHLIKDCTDASITLDFSEGAIGRIGLVHPLELSFEQLSAWERLFKKLKISQPFRQLTREIYSISDAEKTSGKISRFQGIRIKSQLARNLVVDGWVFHNPDAYGQDADPYMYRSIEMRDGTFEAVKLNLKERKNRRNENQRWTSILTLDRFSQKDPDTKPPAFTEVNPIVLSELFRFLSLLK
jgi:hypothetical protein